MGAGRGARAVSWSPGGPALSAPFARRRFAAVLGRRRSAPTWCCGGRPRRWPRRAGPVLHAGSGRALGGRRGERPFLPRAVLRDRRARRGRRGLESRLPARGRRPGHESPVRARGRRGAVGWSGRSGRLLRRRRSGPALLVGGGVGIAPLAILQDAAGGRSPGHRRCSASATRARRGCALLSGRARSRPTTGPSATTAS
jgi:hypothetical protein